MTTKMSSTAVMTSTAKYEATRAEAVRPCCRRAEISAMLRLAGALQRVPGGITIEAELADAVSARRLKANIAGAFDYQAGLLMLPRDGTGSSRYLVRVSDSRAGRNLAHQTGLIGADGRPVSGLPRQVVCGAACDCEAVWRGAFLAGGSLIQAGRCMALEISCPGFEAALALTGAARRLRILAKTRDVRGVDRVVIRDSEALAGMLTRIGAPQAAIASRARRLPSARYQAMSDRSSNMDGANRRRCEEAAELAATRAERALVILGQDAPAVLATAGELRIEHRRLTLKELGQLADPPLSKDSIAGRIRRLLAKADRCAEAAGIPGTQAFA
jgi:DNA-binding protein WhiA